MQRPRGKAVSPGLLRSLISSSVAITEFQVSHWVKKWTYFHFKFSVESHLKRNWKLGRRQQVSQKMVLTGEGMTSAKGLPGDTV